MTNSYNLIAVTGPTATGKTSLAAQIAKRFNGEVISADSRQVYRRMNLGTGKDYSDYIVNDIPVPVHLIDIMEPGYQYSVYEFQRDFFRVFSDLQNRGKMPVLCGGSGMYLNAVLRAYRLNEVPRNEDLRKSFRDMSLDELSRLLSTMKSLHNITDLDTPERAVRAIEIATYYREHSGIPDVPRINALVLGLIYDRAVERKRITERLKNRMKQGMVEEVKNLLESGIPAEKLIYYGLEYRFITRYLLGELDYSTMFRLLNTAIHQFAKRQRTWFRKMEREGTKVHWIPGDLTLEEKLEIVTRLLDPGQQPVTLHQSPLM
jgi:tRNA dimethylallyltransferase